MIILATFTCLSHEDSTCGGDETYLGGQLVEDLASSKKVLHVGDSVLKDHSFTATLTSHLGDDVGELVEASANGITTLLLRLDVVLLLLLVGEARLVWGAVGRGGRRHVGGVVLVVVIEVVRWVKRVEVWVGMWGVLLRRGSGW